MMNSKTYRLTNMKAKPLCLALAGALLISGCGTSPKQSSDQWGSSIPGVTPAKEGTNGSRYALSQDDEPDVALHPSRIKDAVPRYEPIKKAGNKSPYEVWGKTYHVMPSAKGYVERGRASWYGKKFHGHKTSNGELFNMYATTAAHKSLPIPSFAKVTNLDNGKTVIVRVNDRGPFHGDRLIDLSYAAAIKLGYQKKGTARVEVAAITTKPDGDYVTSNPGRQYEPVSTSSKPGFYVQLGSFHKESGASKIAAKARGRGLSRVAVTRVDRFFGDLFRVRVGPFSSRSQAEKSLSSVRSSGFYDAVLAAEGR